MRVRKHRAPNGALRPVIAVGPNVFLVFVRKHRAPNGALRLHAVGVGERVGLVRSESTERQTAH